MNYSNRPYKYGPFDRQEFIVSNSEQQFRAVNTADGYPVFIAFSRHSIDQTQKVWQLRKVSYDSAFGTVSIQWPVDDTGTPSTAYKFNYGPDQIASITAISQSNPCHITANNTFQNGQIVVIKDVLGMTQLNLIGTNLYKVANQTSTGFDLLGVDSTNYSPYTSGGFVQSNPAMQYTYK